MDLSGAARKLSLPLGVAAAAGLAWLSYWSIKETQRQAASVQRAAAGPSGSAIRSKVSHQRVEAADQGERLWSLGFDEIDLDASGRTVSANGLRDGVVYDPQSGKPQVRITADAADYDTESRNFKLFGGVTAVFTSGTVATMDEAEYVESERKLVCRGNVTVKDEGYVGTAPMAIVWVDNDLITCPEGGVVITDDGTELAGREIEYNTETGKFRISGATATVDIEELKKPVRAREGEK